MPDSKVLTSNFLTYTPIVSAVTPGNLSVAYTNQLGRYYRIGRLMWVWARLQFIPTYTTASGNLQVSLPQAAAVFGQGVQGLVLTDFTNISWPLDRWVPQASVLQGTDKVTFKMMGPDVSTPTLAITGIPTGVSSLINFSGTYLVDVT